MDFWAPNMADNVAFFVSSGFATLSIFFGIYNVYRAISNYREMTSALKQSIKDYKDIEDKVAHFEAYMENVGNTND